MTRERFAYAMGVTLSTAQRWERGQSEPSLKWLRKIAEVTGTTLAALVEDEVSV